LQSVPLSVVELERCKALGFAGVEIGTHVGSLNLDDPAFRPFFQACADLDMAVFVHPLGFTWKSECSVPKFKNYWASWLVGMPTETALSMLAVLLGSVLSAHPALRICFAHGGGSFLMNLGRVQHGYACRPDLVATSSPDVDPVSALARGNVWVDGLTHDEDTLLFIMKKMGPHRVCMGSDYPFPLGEVPEAGKMVAEMHQLDDKLKARLLWRNTVEWLHLGQDWIDRATAASPLPK